MASAENLILFDGIGMTSPATSGSATNTTVDATTDAFGVIFQARTADPITALGFRYGARTGTPPTFSIRLESVGTNGRPSGSDIGGGFPTAATFTPPADTTWDGTWRWVDLTNSYTPTRGQFLAMTIRYSSGTIGASNNSSFTRLLSALIPAATRLPISNIITSGTTWNANAGAAPHGYKTAGARYGFIFTSGQTQYGAAASGDKNGMYFTLPAGMGSTYKVRGAQVFGDIGSMGETAVFCIWDTSFNVIQDVSIDTDIIADAAAEQGFRITFDESSLTALNFGTKYYIGFERQVGAVASPGVDCFVLPEQEDRQFFPCGLNRGRFRQVSGVLTETDTLMPQIVLFIDDITEPSGGGGGLIIGPSGLIY